MAIQGLEKENIFGKERNKIFRQDILKFFDFNLQIIQAPGPPVGQHETGTLFFNGEDQKLYLATNYKILNTPDLLWYKLNGNAQDFSKGARTDGTITSSLFTTGKYGTAINFDGVDDKVVIPTAMGLNWDQDWTMSFWIKVPTAIANGEEINILEQYIDATHYFYLVCRASGTPTTTLSFFYHFNTGGGDLSEVGVNLINSWQDTFVFVTMAHDNSANKINGGNKIGTVEETDTNTTASLPDVGFTTEDFEMGRNQAKGDFGDSPYVIDDFKIFNTFRDPIQSTTELTPIAKIDLLNLDKVNWSSYTGAVVAEV